MNVFFMDFRYIRKDAWKHIVHILKVEKVFCFFESSKMPSDIFGTIDVIYKGENTSIKSFGDSIVFNLANKIAHRSNNPDGSVIHIDQNLFLKSKSKSPRYNLLSTDDPNVLVLGKVYNKRFEEYCDEIREKDIGLHIANYLFNLLNKQIGSNSYPNRISFLLFDYLRMKEYERIVEYSDDYDRPCDKNGWLLYENGRVNRVLRREYWRQLLDSFITEEGNVKKLSSFYKLILKLLHEQFSEEYPLKQFGDKKTYSTFIDRDSEYFKKAKQEWDECCAEQKRIAREEDEEEKKRREIEQNGRDYQSEIEEMNRDFWNECGEAGSNCESWPGWG